ncbi:MAG: hypothetical protein QOJ50_2016, partial [Cryptosporangiaceae bacterium]|nr:hypothetical protein [Cryptosporangiaceae bacterium]
AMTTWESVGAVQVEWQPEAADYVEAFTALNRRRTRWLLGVVMLPIAVLGLVFAAAQVRAGEGDTAIVGIVVAVVLPLLPVVLTRGSTKGLWRMYPQLHAPGQVTVDPHAGVSAIGGVVTMRPFDIAVGSSVYPWPSVRQVLETDRVFVVLLADSRNGKKFLLLAKRGVTDPAGLAHLRAMLVS